VRRNLANVDWERFRVYSQYVRRLSHTYHVLRGNFSFAFEGGMVSRLPAGQRDDILGPLPNLRSLTWFIRHTEDIRDVSGILSSKLASLKLSVSDSAEPSLSLSFPHLIDAIRQTSPSISDFSLNLGRTSTRVLTKEQFVSIIRAQNQLHTLRIDVTDLIDNYRNLPVLSNLTELHFHKRELTQNHPPQNLTAEGYASVASLIPAVNRISGYAFHNILPFWINIVPIIGARIREVVLLGSEWYSSGLLRQFISAIGGACPNLIGFTIKALAFSDEGVTSSTFTFIPRRVTCSIVWISNWIPQSHWTPFTPYVQCVADYVR
jgi:hypothetical protein